MSAQGMHKGCIMLHDCKEFLLHHSIVRKYQSDFNYTTNLGLCTHGSNKLYTLFSQNTREKCLSAALSSYLMAYFYVFGNPNALTSLKLALFWSLDLGLALLNSSKRIDMQSFLSHRN